MLPVWDGTKDWLAKQGELPCTGGGSMEFPFRNYMYAVFLAFGVATTINVDMYREDLAAIQNQITIAEVDRGEHGGHILPKPIKVPQPQQQQATPRPAAAGEDGSTAQLLPANRKAADLARMEDDEIAIGLSSGLILVVGHGFKAAARKRRDRDKEQQDERERKERDQKELDQKELDQSG